MLAVVYLEIIIPLDVVGVSLPLRNIRYTSGVSNVIPRIASPEKNIKKGTLTVVTMPAGKVAPVRMGNPVAAEEKLDFGGPTQPEMQAFHSADNSNMVDLFTGDLSYNIPLMDVDGYPVTIGYNSGSGMDAEASWVGLGWNINPGTVTRNLRGIPDDFNGRDSITKELSIAENKTVGASVGADVEIKGMPLAIGGSLGVFKNTYTGWGMETMLDIGLSTGATAKGPLTAGLKITNNSNSGLTLEPTLDYKRSQARTAEHGGFDGSLGIGTSYNSRGGLSGLQVSGGLKMYRKLDKPDYKLLDKIGDSRKIPDHADISFAFPGYSPAMNIPFTSEMTSVTLKVGGEFTIVHPSLFIRGYVTRQFIADADKKLSLPAFGYLNYHHGATNMSALLDFNREKEVTFRDKPAVPNIAVPSYTYDVFTISGEGTGGNFRAYRNDIGFVYDHKMSSRDRSLALSGDIGVGYTFHIGVDLTTIKASTTSALWSNENPLASLVNFRKSDKSFEAAYFRNPGEKTINATSFYDALGGDRVITPRLYQNQSTITSTNKITPYEGGKPQQDIELNNSNVVKPAREKRTQSITYLTAKEAAEVGLSKYIESYELNHFPVRRDKVSFKNEYDGPGTGLQGTYYEYSKDWEGPPVPRWTRALNFPNTSNFNDGKQPWERELGDNFSSTYRGQLKVPSSGVYSFRFDKNDGYDFYLNDELISSDRNHLNQNPVYMSVNLEGEKMYDLYVRYYNAGGEGKFVVNWKSAALGPLADYQPIPDNKYYLTKVVDSAVVNHVTYEKRMNSFRKADHISEISVLNGDGRRYVYGIPVYNLYQKEATFSVKKANGNSKEGLVTYQQGVDDNTTNNVGRDHYYSAEIMPAYAHSYLLTGIVTPDYTDLTGNGISDDDPGNAIRFNYTKIAGKENPYKWRSPATDSATYNEGMKTDDRDDKGSYVAGSKELWYLNSVESRNMIAVFRLGERKDLQAISVNGVRSNGGAKRLERIDLYTKADFQKDSTRARPVKSVHFDYSYELCKGVNGYSAQLKDTGKLTLKRIWFSYNGNEKGRKNPYVFNYNKLNPSYSARMYDGWGNYKDPLQNPGSTSGNLITNAEYPYPLQDSTLAAQNAAAWALDSIVMPSGGRLKINYESDDYAYVQNRRAMQMCKIAGFSWNKPSSLNDISNNLYGYTPPGDNMYVAISIPYEVNSKTELYARYLDGMEKLYFRLSVKMPTDKFGGGYETVPCYAQIDKEGDYGFISGQKTIWLKIKGIDKTGYSGGPISPLVKAAAQFLKFNLPSKAYPGSDTGEDFQPMDAVKILVNQADNVINTILSFEESCRGRGWIRSIDLSRSLVRLNNPIFKKYGGGHRVKSVVTYDHWNKMTGQRESRYGMEYDYTTTKVVNGNTISISSGVAAFEPVIGGEENPFHMPIEYLEQVSVLAPVSNGYTEEPLGEGFFPAPFVGYSKVRVRTINAKKARSVNGFEETTFYTTKDFPTITERTPLNNDTKRRFKSPLGSLLKINVRHFLTVSQGFKIELNDMNGRERSKAYYAETDAEHPIAYTENFYKVDNQQAEVKHLNNTVLTINPKGQVTTSSIGKDVELMLDMREERSLTNVAGVSPNSDLFMVAVYPVTIISMIKLPQRSEDRFRSVAATKVINRHGILDSVVTIDKGSKVVTHNLLFDAESGEAVLTSVQNEYNDAVYNFNYPAGWIYEGMSGAYKNIGVVLDHIDIKGGRISSGLPGNVNDYFFAGDELLMAARKQVAGGECDTILARWPGYFKAWAVNANILVGGTPDIYFVNEDGSPVTGVDVSLKIIRSGRKNISASAGGVTMLRNPVRETTPGNYTFILDESSKVLNASVTEYKETWKVPDRKKQGIIIDTFKNEIRQRVFLVKCSPTDPGQQITVTVPANTFKSVKTLADANAMADDYLTSYGPAIADQQKQCLFYNTVQTKSFKRSNCTNVDLGTWVDYTLPAGTDSSTISVEDANAKTLAKVNANGPAYANANGFCNIYAKLVKSNEVPETVTTDIRWRLTTTYADFTIYFYTDTACTIPYNMPSQQIAVNEHLEYVWKYPGTAPNTIDGSNTILNFTASGYSTQLMVKRKIQIHKLYLKTEMEEVEPPGTTEDHNYTFTLLPNPAFIIKQ